MTTPRKGAFLVLAGLLAAAVLSVAEARQSFLPGVKGYSFTMSPRKLERYCEQRWRGRFWHVGKRYGCDGIKIGSRSRIRIDCQLSHPCIQLISTGSGDGGDGGSSVGSSRGSQGGSNSKP